MEPTVASSVSEPTSNSWQILFDDDVVTPTLAEDFAELSLFLDEPSPTSELFAEVDESPPQARRNNESKKK